ncbi:hypothetical protein [Winogradskyella sp. 3972H.M.0a.05]|uniref:toxin-antitoxin system YwqK family antitoxin n=1 Tax=Winogradskyella sp. 3972H.M.0a.05 TaxID=2950277 RepID=UPI00339767E9
MVKHSTYFIIIFSIFFGFNTQKKIIYQDGFKIECSVYLEDVNAEKNSREYFWFKSGKINNSYGSVGGQVLHDTYSKYYRSNQLAEQGGFDMGLKHGTWKSWFENGRLKTILNWKGGLLHGDYASFDTNGKLIESGTFKNNLKSKLWINHITKDSTYYTKDSTYNKKPENFFQRIFKKRDSLEKDSLKKERALRKAKRKEERNKKKKEKKS